MPTGIYISNLKEFQADLKAAMDATPRELTKALKVGGQPIIDSLRGIPAHRSGALASSYKASVRGTTGSIVNAQPYAGGAEWGAHGHWKGFMKYGPPGRFGALAIEVQADAVLQLIAEQLKDIITLHGWAS
jgi:hypothetical protein